MNKIVTIVIIIFTSINLTYADGEDILIIGFSDTVRIYEYPDSNYISNAEWGDTLFWIKDLKLNSNGYGISKNIGDKFWMKVLFKGVVGWVEYNDIAIYYEWMNTENNKALLKIFMSNGLYNQISIAILNNKNKLIKNIGFVSVHQKCFWIDNKHLCYSDYKNKNIYIFNLETKKSTLVAQGKEPKWDMSQERLIYLKTPYKVGDNKAGLFSVNILGKQDKLIYEFDLNKYRLISYGGEGLTYIIWDIINTPKMSTYEFKIYDKLDKQLIIRIDSKGNLITTNR